MLPPHNETDLWDYPTYTPPDIRFVTWLVTYRFRRQKRIAIEQGAVALGTGPVKVEVGLDAVANGGPVGETNGEIGEAHGGKWEGRGQKVRAGQQRSSTVRVMLDGYFVVLRKAVIVALVLRLGVGAGLGVALWRRFGRGRVVLDLGQSHLGA